ncbi:accessory Sec system protein translocase subunit SecY2 [Streptococcus sp. SGI.013]|uniref:accessory Sec system protein translocase subunit SecY2 n=1 Tax=unclassified Streptococcus TaxID=2608887 RepID=UPI003D00AF4A
MLSRIRIKWQSSLLLKKMLFTLGIVFIYMVGRAIPISTIPLDTEAIKNTTLKSALNNLASVTGGQLSTMTLFSLGLSPVMTSMILWRFLTVFELFKNYTNAQVYRFRMYLALFIGLIQAFGYTASLNFLEVEGSLFTGDGLLRLVTVLILIGGSFVLAWLGNMNTEKGIGGPTVIIIVNMLLSLFQSAEQLFKNGDFSMLTYWGIVILAILAINALILVTIITHRAEYRIPIRRISVSNTYTEENYIPIRLNPAGGMPFMYGMTLMMLPPLIIQGLQGLFPKEKFLETLYNQIGLSNWPGVIIYAIILYLLAIGFTYYNYDPVDITKNMRRGGDYIEHVRPGKETERFIRKRLTIFAHIGAIFICLIGVGPLFLTIGKSDMTGIALFVSNIFIITSLMISIIEQIDMLLTWKKYGKLL